MIICRFKFLLPFCLVGAAFGVSLIEDGAFEQGAPFVSESEGNQPGHWAMYRPKGSDGLFTLDGEGRRGNCALYTKTAEGSENIHLNQVIRVQPETAYEVRAWVKGDGNLKPFFSVSTMAWKPLATAAVAASESWVPVRFFFNSRTNTMVRLEWWGGATGSSFTGVAGTSRLDDVYVGTLSGGVTVNVEVNPGVVVKSGIPPKPIGISENVFLTSDRHYPGRKVSQVNSLKALGGQTVRGMEGNIGDFLVWSVPPYEKPAIRATAWHPGRVYFSTHFNPDGTLLKPMEFDEFLESGKAAGITEFFYVIGIDAIQVGPGTWQHVITDAENVIVAAAEAQARYAKNFGAHMWFEIGNEVDLDDKPDRHLSPWTPEAYAALVKRLSAAIKKGDPAAKVGVNGGFKENRVWLDSILPQVAQDIDFLVAHAYSPTGTRGMDRVREAIDHLAVPESVKGLWPICLTESSSYNPGSAILNDLAESTRNFVRYGVNLLAPKVRYMHFWTDHAADNRADSGKCAFGPEGGLLPMGQVLAIWNENLGDRMVKAEADMAEIPVFATVKGDGTLNVFVANTLGVPHQFLVRLADPAIQQMTCRVWTGTNGSDQKPQWVSRGLVEKKKGGFPVDLPLVGFSMLSSVR